MPCHDSSSIVSVTLDSNERLVGFDFGKITCGKEIGEGGAFREYCLGRNIDDILRLEFVDIRNALKIETTEDEFLLYLEWDALRAAVAQYRGLENAADRERCQIAAVISDGDQTEIRQSIRPPANMPGIVSCAVRARRSG
jgi:hypothetical protein